MTHSSKKSAPRVGQIKLLSLDLDGTLLHSTNTVSKRNLEVLRRARDKGVHIALNSGRMSPSMEMIVNLLGDLDVYIISYNGAQVRDLKSRHRRSLFERPLPAAVGHELVQVAQQRELQINYYLDEVIYSEDGPKLRKHIDLYFQRTGSPYKIVSNLQEFTQRSPLKALFVVDPEVRGPLEHELAPRFSARATITRTDPEYLEFLHPEVDKGVGLKALAHVLGLSMEETMSCGDADNDEPMVTVAGWGVGMANAKPLVRSRADALTEKNNNEDGVAEAIERWILF